MTTVSSSRGVAATPHDELIYFDQIHSLFLLLRKSVAGNLTGAVFVLWVMWDQISAPILFGWFGAHLANQTWRLILYYRYQRARPDVNGIHRWGRLWTAGGVLSGVIWGSSTFLMFVPGSPTYQALLLITLFAVSAAGLPLIARHTPALYGFVLPALLPINVRFLVEGGEGHVFLGIVGLITLATILTFGRDLNRVVRASLAQKYENLDLIEGLRSQTEAAEAARREADVANRSKSSFLAAASHDLRQPLHALGLFASALSERVKDPGVQDVINSVNASVEALERLFNELLDISKLDAGAVRPQMACFPIAGLLDNLRVAFEPEAGEKGVRLKVMPCSAHVVSDPVLLERCARNLVSNALRYTARGRVLVGCRRAGGRLRFEVWDTGVGIAAPDRARIFEEFYQAGSPARHSKKGMGLGLSIVKRLAALLGHEVSVESAPGRGSVFRIGGIALGRAPEPGRPAAPPAAAAPAALNGRLVLVIDDEEPILEGMRVALTGWGAEVIAARNGDEALDGLGIAGRYPDLIIADYRLQGGENGLATIDRIRAELGLALPAILVTGSTSPERGSEAGARHVDVLYKPVVPARLREMVAEKLERHEQAPDSSRGGEDDVEQR